MICLSITHLFPVDPSRKTDNPGELVDAEHFTNVLVIDVVGVVDVVVVDEGVDELGMAVNVVGLYRPDSCTRSCS